VHQEVDVPAQLPADAIVRRRLRGLHAAHEADETGGVGRRAERVELREIGGVRCGKDARSESRTADAKPVGGLPEGTRGWRCRRHGRRRRSGQRTWRTTV
jgi:hypothetical protein